MNAIVEIAGKQFRVEKNKQIKVPHLDTAPGESVSFDRVLAVTEDGGKTSFGTPVIEKMTVNAKVISHGRDKKIIVFKKKRRKGYRRKHGHRQGFSLIEIIDITQSKAKPAASKAADETSKPAQKKAAAPKAKKSGASTKTKAAPAAKTAEKKPTARKSGTAKPKTGTAKKGTSKTAGGSTAKKATAEKKSTAPKKTTKKPADKSDEKSGEE